MRGRVTGVDFDGALKLLLGLLPVPVVIEREQTQLGVAFSGGRIQFQRFAGGRSRFRPGYIGRNYAGSQERVTSCQPRIGRGKSRIARNCVLKVFDALPESRFRSL